MSNAKALTRIQAAGRALTKRQREVLELMALDSDSDNELVYERGAGGWLGEERVSPRTVFALLRAAVISLESDPQTVGMKGHVERYTINETGLKLLGEAS